METAAFIISFLGLLIMNMPIAFAMVLSSFLYLLLSDGIAVEIMIQRITSGVNSFPLMAVPLFILAGELMNRGGITERLTNFARALIGHITGGLGHVVIVTNMLMAGISGSAVADAAGTGAILIPALKKSKYGSAYAAALTASAATIGPIIPPSITMVVYGVAAGVSVGKLFIGGIIPGILMGLSLMITNWVVTRKKGVPREQKASFHEFKQSFAQSIFAILMPVIILGGILWGVVTPTEAAGIAVVYAFVIGSVVYKEFSLKVLREVAINTILTTSKITFIVASAALFGWLLTYQNISGLVAGSLFSLSTNPLVILLVLNIVLLILGCFMETVAIILMIMPILLPIFTQVGIDPLHFGVVMALNLMIGTLTPPVGVLMFVVSEIAEISISQFVKAVWPFWIVLFISLLIVTYLPQTVLWLPQVLYQ